MCIRGHVDINCYGIGKCGRVDEWCMDEAHVKEHHVDKGRVLRNMWTR